RDEKMALRRTKKQHFANAVPPACGHYSPQAGVVNLLDTCGAIKERRTAFPGRVEDWRASWPRYPDRATFPAHCTSHAACGFPALRAPICFTSGLMGPIIPGQLSVGRVALDSC